MPVTVSYHAGSGKGSIGVAGSEFSAATVTTVPTRRRSVAPPMTQGRRQRRDRPFVRDAGFLVTVMVQIISRIPPTSSDSLMTIPPPVIGIQDEAQHTFANTVVDHQVNLDQRTEPIGGQARASCACGWDSEWVWSRRRAAEAGSSHLRLSRAAG